MTRRYRVKATVGQEVCAIHTGPARENARTAGGLELRAGRKKIEAAFPTDMKLANKMVILP